MEKEFSRKTVSKEQRITLLVVVILCCAVISAIMIADYIQETYGPTQPGLPEVKEYSLEKYNGDYLIRIVTMGDSCGLGYIDFELKDSDGIKVMDGDFDGIYGADFRFMDENFTPQKVFLTYHDSDRDWRLSENDTLIIVSEKNGGMAKENMSLALRYYSSYDESPIFFEITIRDNIPESDIPPNRYNVSNHFVIENSSISNIANLTISQEHVAFSSYQQYQGNKVEIGVTLINNSTKEIDNISVSFFANEDAIKEITNISVQGETMKRVVFSHEISYFVPEGKDTIIRVEVMTDDWEKPLRASTSLFIVGRYWT